MNTNRYAMIGQSVNARMRKFTRSLFYILMHLLALGTEIAKADQVKFARFCNATQNDDCIGVSRGGQVFAYFGENRIVGKASLYKTAKGVVARYENRFYCGVSDTRISKSYLVCTAKGWQFSEDFMNLTDPWNPTDLFDGN